MNAVFKKIRILVLAGLLALAIPTAVNAETGFDFNPEEHTFLCVIGAIEATTTSYTRQAGTSAQACIVTTTVECVEGPDGEPMEKTTVEEDCSPFSRNKGCFTPETMILMADKSEKKIIELKAGDMVWNPIKETPAPVGKMVGGPEKLALLEIGYGDYTVEVTTGHPMIVYTAATKASLSSKLSSSEGFIVKRADQISLNDYILSADGEYHKVTVLKQLPIKEGQVVFNFSLDVDSDDPADHAVVADGVVTGDLDAQLALGQKDSI